MREPQLVLGRSTRLDVEYEDRTRFGSAVSGRLDADVAARAAAHLAVSASRGGREADFVRDTAGALRDLLRPGLLGGLFERSGVLRDDCLYPAPELVEPCALRVRTSRTQAGVAIPLEAALKRELARWIGEFARGGHAPRAPAARRLWEALAGLGALEPRVARAAIEPREITFVGHAAVLLATPRTRLLIDPFLVPADATDEPGYEPIGADELLPDAILITHSHEDHFHPGTLLRFGPDVPIFVPRVPRESLLSTDMARRLRELGFRDVRELGWHEEASVGDYRVVALPMYGEQPTTGTVLHPEVRNVGNTYLVEGGGRRYAFTVDAGKDRRGDVRDLAAEAAARYGTVDVLFGGFRTWSLYPVQYLNPVFARYFLFVPEASLKIRQKIMNDADDLLDTAERWGARCVIPYANGGAPWYHALGLGPRPDAPQEADVHFNPCPEHVVDVADRRSSTPEGPLASPVDVLVLRPGQSLETTSHADAVIRPGESSPADRSWWTPSVRENVGHVWPVAARGALEHTSYGTLGRRQDTRLGLCDERSKSSTRPAAAEASS